MMMPIYILHANIIKQNFAERCKSMTISFLIRKLNKYYNLENTKRTLHFCISNIFIDYSLLTISWYELLEGLVTSAPTGISIHSNKNAN
jgi:hypothetical protein